MSTRLWTSCWILSWRGWNDVLTSPGSLRGPSELMEPPTQTSQKALIGANVHVKMMRRVFPGSEWAFWVWLHTTVGMISPHTVSAGQHTVDEKFFILQQLFDKHTHTHTHMCLCLFVCVSFRWNLHDGYIFHWHFAFVSPELSAFWVWAFHFNSYISSFKGLIHMGVWGNYLLWCMAKMSNFSH